jgi:hypothetical protein
VRWSFRTLVAGFAIGVVAASVSLVLAHSGENSSGGSSLTSSDSGSSAVARGNPPSPSADSGWWDPSWQTIDDAVKAGVLSDDKPPDPGEAAEVDFAAEGAPTWIVEDCRSETALTTPLHCKAIIAIAEGKLEPGSYSDSELLEKLDE